jgi:hypothetical protein
MATLYQQGTQRIEIVVRKESDGSSVGAKTTEPESAGGKGGGETTWKTAIFGSESPERIRRVIKINATHMIAVSKQVVGLAMEYRHAGISYKTGDQSLQDQVKRKVEVIEDASNVASSVAMGAVFGSFLGAAMGLISSGASTIVKYRSREREFNYKMFKENNAIEYKRARAHVNLTTGRLR